MAKCYGGVAYRESETNSVLRFGTVREAEDRIREWAADLLEGGGGRWGLKLSFSGIVGEYHFWRCEEPWRSRGENRRGSFPWPPTYRFRISQCWKSLRFVCAALWTTPWPRPEPFPPPITPKSTVTDSITIFGANIVGKVSASFVHGFKNILVVSNTETFENGWWGGGMTPNRSEAVEFESAIKRVFKVVAEAVIHRLLHECLMRELYWDSFWNFVHKYDFTEKDHSKWIQKLFSNELGVVEAFGVLTCTNYLSQDLVESFEKKSEYHFATEVSLYNWEVLPRFGYKFQIHDRTARRMWGVLSCWKPSTNDLLQNRVKVLWRKNTWPFWKTHAFSSHTKTVFERVRWKNSFRALKVSALTCTDDSLHNWPNFFTKFQFGRMRYGFSQTGTRRRRAYISARIPILTMGLCVPKYNWDMLMFRTSLLLSSTRRL